MSYRDLRRKNSGQRERSKALGVIRGAEGESGWNTMSERRGPEVERELESCHMGPWGHQLRRPEKIYLREVSPKPRGGRASRTACSLVPQALDVMGKDRALLTEHN